MPYTYNDPRPEVTCDCLIICGDGVDEDGDGMGEPVNRIALQCVFAAGPHKHERY